MLKALLIDHHDSFTFNLAALIQRAGVVKLTVQKPEEVKMDTIGLFDKIFFSPGPGHPDEYTLTRDIVKYWGPTKSVLGVCLGHQIIGLQYGASLVHMGEVHHGRVNYLRLCSPKGPLFKGLPDDQQIGVYHSWCLSADELPDSVQVTGVSDDNVIMAVQHKTNSVFGVQFHPESFITRRGEQMIRNFLQI